jgi:uncharacterized protein YfaS (alpha-2-macroglobulin family)
MIQGRGARAGILACLVAGGVAVSMAARSDVRAPDGPAQLAASAATQAGREAIGLTFRLSDAQVIDNAPPRIPTAAAAPLNEREAQALLDALPPLEAPASDRQVFALREKSLPPPRPGKTVADSFPPAASPGPPPAVSTGPLTVLRRAPEGEVALAPNLSVTFSQPMVAITSHGDLAQQAVPVRLTPQPAGSWRWVGAQTLLFETPTRLPMATDFQVEVPAGTTSASGSQLATPERWVFSTPPPTLVWSHPSDEATGFDPLFFAAFDQNVDGAAVLRTIRVQAGSSTPRLRLATPEEVRADGSVRDLSKVTPEGRWIAFRAEERLPADAAVTVTLGPGTASAEGPKTTTKKQEWRFRTHGPMRVTGQQCGWRGRCEPRQPWRIDLSNPVDVETFREDMVHVEPALPGVQVAASGSAITIQGRPKGRTTYGVTIAGVPDVFGQTLEKPGTIAFKVEAASPWLMSAASDWTGMVVLDPAAALRFPVYSLNYDAISVRVHTVSPADWPAFEDARARARPSGAPQILPGRVVMSKTIRVKGLPGEPIETTIDLAPALPRGTGQLVLLVQPVSPPTTRPDYVEVRPGPPQPVLVWIQATRIGLDAFADGEELLAWASALDDGQPLPDVKVSLFPGQTPVSTGPDGLARLPLGDQAPTLVARLGDDIAMLPGARYDGGFKRSHAHDTLNWYVFDDRHLYRPGEEVHVKGWVRISGTGRNGDLRAAGPAVRQVSYKLISRGNEVTRGGARLNPFGAFDFAVRLPATMALGSADLEFEADTDGIEQRAYTHDFQVEEFRRPEFEVTSSASEGPHFVGGHAIASVTASYFAGGGLSDAEVQWNVSSAPASFTPPNRGDFTFGSWIPWWVSSDDDEGGHRAQQHKARTSAEGRHALRIDFDAVNPPRPASLNATATVTDVNRQAWATRVRLLVHPSSLYVGLKTPRYFVERGQPLAVDLIVTDLDGGAVGDRPVRVRAERLTWKQRGGRWREEPADTQMCSVVSATDPSRCTFRTAEGGTYRITASVTDADARPNETRIERWVSGGAIRPTPEIRQEDVSLIPDKDEYRAGDTAEILIIPPFSPAEALMTLRRSGMVRTERFRITGASHTLRIPIEERWTPNIFVQVDLLGAAPRVTEAGDPVANLPKRPAFASGSLRLAVPPLARTLALQVEPREKRLEPGGETTLDITVKGQSGKPVAAGEVAVVVADEAVLSMTGYRSPDPISHFYQMREEGVSDQHLRGSVLLARLPRPGPPEMEPLPPPMMAMAARVVGVLGGAEGGLSGGIRLRADFNPLALFAASVPIDASGHAEVRVKVPDNLTRYRVMAVAATAGVEFGSGESTITARLPLMVRASAPRFLNVGDRFEFPVVLQNQTGTALSVDVALRAANADVTAGRGRRVQVPANDRVEVRFPVAASRPGTARFQVAATSGRWSDASQVSLPVWTPATTEAFATYGQIDQGAIAQPVKAPSDASTEFGGLEIATSSTALQALTDAVLYLVSYPFECTEQLSSRVLAVAALKDVLSAFSASGLPAAEDLSAGVNRDLLRLSGLQNDDGGFALWQRGDESWPYVSIHVAHALERAKAKGFTVPAKTLERSHNYLKTIERRIPAQYGDGARRVLTAYALYVRKLGGDADPGRARELIREAGLPNLSFEAVGWLLAVLSGDASSSEDLAAIRTYLNNHATETAGAAHFAVSYGDGAHLLFESDRRADAIVLDALITDQPKSDLIPKIVEGLLAHRKAGRWENTQENVFILLALDRYFNTYESVTPDFIARAWLGDRYAGEQAFKGRTTDRHVVAVPMNALGDDPTDLILSKEGAGRLYYRIGLQYAPRTLELRPMDRGFTIERSYEAVDDKSDVQRGQDEAWHIRAGSRVRVRVSMVAPARRYHVALVDPLPAGLEALNPVLATTGPMPPPPRQDATVAGGRGGLWWLWGRPWFEHQNLRDDRAEAFASLLWEGVYTYSYVARATTPGQFLVPPPHAEEMYHPETFGRGATDRVIIEIR